MKILDMSTGKKGIWFDKNNPLVTFLDIRPETNPTFICDTRNIPAEVGNDFDLIVFDPPHLNLGKNSNFAKDYGHFTQSEIMDTISRSSAEAHRISKPTALMAFKWNDHDTRLEKVLGLMKNWTPLFGNRLKSGPNYRTMTYWVVLNKTAPLKG